MRRMPGSTTGMCAHRVRPHLRVRAVLRRPGDLSHLPGADCKGDSRLPLAMSRVSGWQSRPPDDCDTSNCRWRIGSPSWWGKRESAVVERNNGNSSCLSPGRTCRHVVQIGLFPKYKFLYTQFSTLKFHDKEPTTESSSDATQAHARLAAWMSRTSRPKFAT